MDDEVVLFHRVKMCVKVGNKMLHTTTSIIDQESHPTLRECNGVNGRSVVVVDVFWGWFWRRRRMVK